MVQLLVVLLEALPCQIQCCLLNGTQSIMGTAIRVLAAGMLAGVMMESGAAESIANAIVQKLGEKKAILSLALSTMVITAVGVFIPVAVLIVAPIALSVGKSTVLVSYDY